MFSIGSHQMLEIYEVYFATTDSQYTTKAYTEQNNTTQELVKYTE